MRRRFILGGIIAMMMVVAVSNYLVQFPVRDWHYGVDLPLSQWLTWAAFTYPVAFLVTDIMNRKLGATDARLVVIVGFAFAVLLSIWLATPRIALASGTAFLVSQLLDVSVFDRLRHGAWWQAPLFSSAIASVIDTALFFSLAFALTDVPWVTLAAGDLAAKALMVLVLLLPFRLLASWSRPLAQSPA